MLNFGVLLATIAGIAHGQNLDSSMPVFVVNGATETAIYSTVAKPVYMAVLSVSSGPAGGDLTGTYPNPLVSRVQPGAVDFSTITAALAGKLSNTSAVPNGLIDLSTVTSALAGKFNVGAIPPQYIDLSTVTTALSGKLSSTSAVPNGLIDLSTVTSALAGKLSNTTAIPNAIIDLSTVTTALAGKQATGNYITSLTGNVTASGPGAAAATIVSVPQSAVNLSTVTSALALKFGIGAIPPQYIDLSTVTTALAGKLSTTGTAASVASGGVDFSTITTALNGKLSSTAAVPNALVDLSTVTSALALKFNVGAIPAQYIDLSTVTTALAGKLATTGTAVAVASGGVDFSTITAALSGKQPTGNYITSLTGPITASGPGAAAATIIGPIPSAAVDLSTVTAQFNVVATATATLHTESVSTSRIDLSTITTALGLKADDAAVVHLAGSETITGAKDIRTISSSMTVQGTAFSVGGNAFVIAAGSVSIGAPINTTAAMFDVNGNVEFDGSEIVVGTSTVQGNAFSVGGSTLVVVGGKVGIGNATPQETLDVTGSFAVESSPNVDTLVVSTNGSIVAASSMTAAYFIGDGRSLTNITNSSMTVVPTYSTTQTSFLVAGASVTIVTTGKIIILTFSGDASNSGTNTSCFFGFTEDGAQVSPFTATVGVTASGQSANNNGRSNASFSYRLRAPAPGSHTYAFMMRAGGGTCAIDRTNSANPQWSATEQP